MDDTARLEPHIGEALQAAVLTKHREAPLKRDMMICTSQSMITPKKRSMALTSSSKYSLAHRGLENQEAVVESNFPAPPQSSTGGPSRATVFYR